MTTTNKEGTRLLCERCKQWLGDVRFSSPNGAALRTYYTLRSGFLGEHGHAATSRDWRMTTHAKKRLQQGKAPAHRRGERLEPSFEPLTVAAHRVTCPACMLKQEIAPPPID